MSKMKLKQYLGALAFVLGTSLYSNAQTNLEFILQDTLDNPLSGGTVVLQGISDPNFLEVKETDENGSATFSVLDNNFFSYFGFHFGYHPESGSVFSDQDKTIQLELTPFAEGEWWSYYVQNGVLAASFISFDEDIYYVGGDEFNYEFEIGSISEEEISFSNVDVSSGIYDENGDPALWPSGSHWGGPNPDLTYDITFRPRAGWLIYNAQGNNAEACIGESYGTFNGTPFDVSGEGEWVCEEVETQDNVVPENILSGNYQMRFELLGLELISQYFYVRNEVPDTTPPEVTITEPVDDFTYFNTASPTKIEYNIFDENPSDSIRYSLDGGETKISIPWGEKIEGLLAREGTNDWGVYATDVSGNKGFDEVRFNVSPPIGVYDEQKTLEHKLGVYPNPTNSSFRVEYYKDAEIRIYNVLGQQVYKGFGHEFNISLDNSGIYFIKMGDEKIVKQTILK